MEKLGKKRREESGTVWYTFVCKELRYMKEQVLAVQRMQDYIAKHCAAEITLSDLSCVVVFPVVFLQVVPGCTWNDTHRVYPQIPTHRSGKAAA